MKYLLATLCLAAVLGFSSCSSSTTPTTNADYFKGLDKLGNYWVYMNSEIDTNGVMSSISYTDSTWVNGTQFVDGKTATQMITYSDPGTGPQRDTNYIYRDGNKVYAYIDAQGLDMLDTAAPTRQWTLVADLDATKPWLVLDTIHINQEQDLGTTTLVVKAKIYATCSKAADSTIKLASGTSVSTRHFTLNPMISGTVAPKGIPLSAPIGMSGGGRHQFYADGMALVAERVEPSTFSVGDGSFFPPTKSPGSYRVLVRSHIQ